jgi:PKD repeat protein
VISQRQRGWAFRVKSAHQLVALAVFLLLGLSASQASAADCNHNGTCGDAVGEDCQTCPGDCDPRPTFTASSHNVRAGHPIHFQGQGGDLFPVFYLSPTVELSGDSLTYRYPSAGDYTVRFGGVDGLCNTPGLSDPQVIHVEPAECNGNGTCEQGLGETCETCPAECDPAPTFDMPLVATALSPVQFTGHGDFVQPPVWDFGDGNGGQGHQVFHSYSSVNDFNVRFGGKDPVCHTMQFSPPRQIHVVSPGGCNQNDLCETELGETCFSCVPDCGPCSGPNCQVDGTCNAAQGETCTTCPIDCDKPPTFTVSTRFGVVGHPLIFTASPWGEDPGAKWDFGIGEPGHLPAIRNPYTYTYFEADTYNVKYTATDLACNTPQDSLAVPITIAAEPPCSLEECDDAAAVESFSFPPTVCSGTSATATVTVRNIGTNTWTREAGYKLGTLVDPSPFSSANRVELPAGVQVPPGATHTFTIGLDRVPAPGQWTSPWRMLREHLSWFGGTASAEITVGSGCGGSGPPNGPGSAPYQCTGSVTDAHGTALPGRAVRLTAQRYRNETQFEDVAHRDGVSEVDGEFTVTLPEQAAGVDRLLCRVWQHLAIKPGEPNRKYLLLDGSANGVVQLHIVEAPAPKAVHEVKGLDKEVVARVGLYTTGAYDKAMIIPEPMNIEEKKKGARKLDGLWWTYEPYMRAAAARDVAVWIVNMPSTGLNLHEQAAELAQGIQWAAHGYPDSLPNGAPNFNRTVGILGISLGGITSRIATARWESDAQWRSDLGLAAEVPVSKMVFVDGALKGAIGNMDLQNFLWGHDREADYSLNTCAFQQLIMHSAVGAQGVCSPGPSPHCNYDSFFLNGLPVRFPGNGVCDQSSGGYCICKAGPAVETINGNGFATLPIAAYSDGGWGVPNQCYGNEDDVTAAGDNLCPDREGPHAAVIPHVGDTMLKIVVHPPFPADITFHMKAEALDLVPGSRLPVALGDFQESDKYAEQYFASTFIPITSSLAHPNGGCGPGNSFVACRNSGKSNPHVKPDPAAGDWIMNIQLFPALEAPPMNLAPRAEMATPAAGQPGQPLSFDGTPSGDPDGTLTQHRWDFGDGTVQVGTSPAHTFSAPGVYDVRLTVTDNTGRTDTAHRRVRVGPPNQAPSAISAHTQTALVGQSVTFDASGSDDVDGWIEKQVWSFGDGTVGEGEQVAHVYRRPGTYDVSLTLHDDETKSVSTHTQVTVSEPAYEASTPIAPAGCANSLRPQFSWSAVNWATRYWLQVYSTGLPAPLVDERELTGTAHIPLNDLPATLPLRWRVRACHGTSCGAWSAAQAFTATCSAPPAPSPVAPEGCLITAQPTLSWTAVGGASSYDLSLERALNGQVVQAPNVAGTSYLVPTALSAYTEYRFRVRARSGATAGAWSPYRFFTTHCLPEQVGTPAPLDPANASYNPMPLFTWEAASNANDYQIEVTSPGLGAFSSGWYPGPTNCPAKGRCALTLPAALIGGPSSWRIRARNTSATGPWSPSVPFTVTGTVQSPWALVAAADFNADGKRDFVWQHAQSGDVRFWLMNGTVRTAVAEPTPNNAGGGEWEVAGAADFNADNKPDLLFQNVATGELSVWFMNGTTRLAVDTPYPDRPSSDVQRWRVQALGDYDGDGKADILWQHQTEGWLVAWLMDGIRQKSAVNPTPNRPASDHANWRVATTELISPGERDAHALWLFQHQTAGWLVGWQMLNLVRDAVPAVVPNLPEGDAANWKIVAAFDVDGDGKSDLVLRHRATGANVVWRMNGATRLGTLPLDSY